MDISVTGVGFTIKPDERWNPKISRWAKNAQVDAKHLDVKFRRFSKAGYFTFRLASFLSIYFDQHLIWVNRIAFGDINGLDHACHRRRDFGFHFHRFGDQ